MSFTNKTYRNCIILYCIFVFHRLGLLNIRPSDITLDLRNVRPSDVRPSDGPSDVRPLDVRPLDVRPSDVRPSDVRPSDVRPSDVRPSDVALALRDISPRLNLRWLTG